MIYKVVWSRRARRSYDELVDSYLENGHERMAVELIDRVEEVIFAIRRLPRMFPEIPAFGEVRKAVLTTDVSLYYRVGERELTLVLLWPSRGNPKTLQGFVGEPGA